MSHNLKELRGQMRQIVKELFPQLVSTELYKELQLQNQQTLEKMTKLLTDAVHKLEARQKDIQNMILRELVAKQPSDKV